MKKKLLAIVVAITMLAALFVPMLAVSADAEAKTVVFEIGELTYNEQFGEIEVPLNIVENNSDIYAAEIVLESNDGLVCSALVGGNIQDEIDKGGREGIVKYGFNYTNNAEISKTVIDSAEPTKGVSTTGWVVTFCYKAPEGFTEADMAGYTFKFGEATMLVAFDGSEPEAVLKAEEAPACEHAETEDVVTKEATCTEAGSKDIKCTACGEVLETVAIDALGHGAEKEVIAKEAEIGVAGLKEFRCSVCDAVLRTEEIPALIDPNVKTVVFEIGELTYNEQFGEIEVPLNIVENNSDIYAAEIVLENENGLVCSSLVSGNIQDEIDKGGREGIVKYGFNYTNNAEISKTVIDSAEPTKGVSTTGWVVTFCYKAPEGFTEADMADYTFKFGASTMLVAFDGSEPVAVLRDKPAEPCTHEETKEVVVKEATCTEAGSKNVVCVKCGEVLDTIAIDALGHGDTEEVVTKEATCTEAGSKDIKCTVCGEVLETKAIDALGHTFEPDPENDVAPTCTEAGKKAYKCACGETKFEEVPATGHTFKVDAEASVDATCTEDGKLVEKCACGEVKETVVPAKGHTFVEDETKRVNPTLEAEGKQVFVCECGETKEVVVAKLEGKVEDKEAGFEVKVEEGKGLPTDIAPVEKEAPAKDKLPEGLKAVTSIIFDTDFNDLVKDVVAEIVIDLAKYIDVKDYNTVSIGVLKDGKVEVIEAKFDGSKVTFNGKVDGEIVLLVEDKAEVEEVKPEATKPGDDFSAVLYIAFALVAAAGVVVIGKKRISL